MSSNKVSLKYITTNGLTKCQSDKTWNAISSDSIKLKVERHSIG